MLKKNKAVILSYVIMIVLTVILSLLLIHR